MRRPALPQHARQSVVGYPALGSKDWSDSRGAPGLAWPNGNDIEHNLNIASSLVSLLRRRAVAEADELDVAWRDHCTELSSDWTNGLFVTPGLRPQVHCGAVPRAWCRHTRTRAEWVTDSHCAATNLPTHTRRPCSPVRHDMTWHIICTILSYVSLALAPCPSAGTPFQESSSRRNEMVAALCPDE